MSFMSRPPPGFGSAPGEEDRKSQDSSDKKPSMFSGSYDPFLGSSTRETRMPAFGFTLFGGVTGKRENKTDSAVSPPAVSAGTVATGTETSPALTSAALLDEKSDVLVEEKDSIQKVKPFASVVADKTKERSAEDSKISAKSSSSEVKPKPVPKSPTPSIASSVSSNESSLPHGIRDGDWQCPTRGCRNNVPGGCYGSRTHCKLCGVRNPKLGDGRVMSTPLVSSSSQEEVNFENRLITKVADSYFVVGKDIYVSKSSVPSAVLTPRVGLRVSGIIRARLNQKDRYPWRAIKCFPCRADSNKDVSAQSRHGWDTAEMQTLVLVCCHLYNRAVKKSNDLHVPIGMIDFQKLGGQTKSFIQKAGGVRSFIGQHSNVFGIKGIGKTKNLAIFFEVNRSLAFMSNCNRSCHTSWNKATAGEKPLEFVIDQVWKSMPSGIAIKDLIGKMKSKYNVEPYEKSLLTYLRFFDKFFVAVDTEFEAVYRGIVIRTLPSLPAKVNAVISEGSTLAEAMERISVLEAKLKAEQDRSASYKSKVASLEKKLKASEWFVPKLSTLLAEYARMSKS